MFRLLETIKIKEGKIFNLTYHSKRMNEARKALFNSREEIDPAGYIHAKEEGFYKCRVLYNEEIREIHYVPYALPSIKSLKIVKAEEIDYFYKYEDRSELRHLYEKRGEADDILIIKEGKVTDTFFCNVFFQKGKEFYTPDTFLLNGTKRQRLLQEGRIKEVPITKEDIWDFDRIYLINALIDPEDHISLPTKNILP